MSEAVKKLIAIIKYYEKCRDEHEKACDEGLAMESDFIIDEHANALAALDRALPAIRAALSGENK